MYIGLHYIQKVQSKVHTSASLLIEQDDSRPIIGCMIPTCWQVPVQSPMLTDCMRSLEVQTDPQLVQLIQLLWNVPFNLRNQPITKSDNLPNKARIYVPRGTTELVNNRLRLVTCGSRHIHVQCHSAQNRTKPQQFQGCNLRYALPDRSSRQCLCWCSQQIYALI